MPKHNKPKFKKGEIVVFHEGNWKYLVMDVFWDKDGEVVYFLECAEDDDNCEKCTPEAPHHEFMEEAELMDYDEWCDHTEKQDCKTCCN